VPRAILTVDMSHYAPHLHWSGHRASLRDRATHVVNVTSREGRSGR